MSSKVTPVGGIDYGSTPLGGDDPFLALPMIPGPPGLSAYEVALANGFVGTEAEWLDSLSGKDPASDEIIAGLVAAPFTETHEAVVGIVHTETTANIDPVLLFENALI